MEVFSVKIFLPLFYVRYREAWGVRLSSRLPAPRTLLGALAKSLGVYIGINSGEERIGNNFARNILTECVEVSSYAFVRPISYLVKSSQLLRIVPIIEKNQALCEDIADVKGAEFIRKISGWHDAFKHDIILSSEMEVVFAVNHHELNENLLEHKLEKISIDDFLKIIKLIDRIGPSEALCNVISVKYIDNIKKEKDRKVNTYVPFGKSAVWAIPNLYESQTFIVEQLYPNLRLIGEKKLTIKSREVKINFILPLRSSRGHKGIEILEPTEILLQPMKGFSVYSIQGVCEDDTLLVLPEMEVGF